MSVENPAAFPSRKDEPLPGGGGYRNDRPGMTLRDWFASQALAPIVTAAFKNCESAANVAAASYELADAMLAERAKSREQAA